MIWQKVEGSSCSLTPPKPTQTTANQSPTKQRKQTIQAKTHTFHLCWDHPHIGSGFRSPQAETLTEARKEILTFHHEGFFWRCWFFGEGQPETIWTFWYTSQAHPKHCMHGYLFPMPVTLGPFPHPSYDTTAVYRGFWTAFIMLAVAGGLVGGLLLVCGVPFVSAKSYKVGGGFLLASGKLSSSSNRIHGAGMQWPWPAVCNGVGAAPRGGVVLGRDGSSTDLE
uniref:Transmembrane protein 182 n=1 Tax=Anser cygnoides TaxID=8845 RepID=A0A8B9DC59_ANSCY